MSEWLDNQKHVCKHGRNGVLKFVHQTPTTSAATPTPQTTPNSAVGSQSFASKDISDIRNDYLQKQSELQPIKPQSPF